MIVHVSDMHFAAGIGSNFKELYVKISHNFGGLPLWTVNFTVENGVSFVCVNRFLPVVLLATAPFISEKYCSHQP
jgi:hypothetical protein